MGKALPQIGRTPEESEFWSNVDMTGWHWYYIGSDLTIRKAREKSWGYTYAPLLPKYYLEVWCDDENCIRPHHTYIGKLSDMAYAVQRRQAQKRKDSIELQKDKKKKITDDDVEKIWDLLSHGMKQSDVGNLFGVSRKLIHEIVKGRKRVKKTDANGEATIKEKG